MPSVRAVCKFMMSRLNYRQVGGLFAVKDTAGVEPGLSRLFYVAWSVAHKCAGLNGRPNRKDCWNPMARRQCDDLHAATEEQIARIDEYRANLFLNDFRKGRVNFP